KKDHVDLTVSGQAGYEKTTGFERYDFMHNALPEVDFNEVTCEARLFTHWFSMPLFISSMTGGYAQGGAVNAIIASFCEQYNLPFGVGSQRVMLEDKKAMDTFRVVREKAPTAFIASNIGGAQIIDGMEKEHIESIVDIIRADALIIHLNPLQELMQTEGDQNFKGVKEGIRRVVGEVEFPVIVKETGAGLSKFVVEDLMDCGVAAVDVAGSGGTSWAKVENQRSKITSENNFFNEWGIPTADCLLQLKEIEHQDIEVIASGGIRNSIDIAKAMCLGASFTATAQPVIQAVTEGGYEGLEALYTRWQHELKTILCLLGCERPQDLSFRHLRVV
ncbi:MAG: type 2 isopentenyl-diphosphate Delta-isomerase, partial [Balneolales bacterium]